MRDLALSLALAGLVLAAPLAAKDSLGVYGAWGAFRDASVPRCYAIATPIPDRGATNREAYASIGTWPEQRVRGQVYLRLSREAPSGAATLSIGRQRFALTAKGSGAWAKDARMDAAIVAAMRSAESMTVRSRDASGRLYAATYELSGAASALDAATLACARPRR